MNLAYIDNEKFHQLIWFGVFKFNTIELEKTAVDKDAIKELEKITECSTIYWTWQTNFEKPFVIWSGAKEDDKVTYDL